VISVHLHLSLYCEFPKNGWNWKLSYKSLKKSKSFIWTSSKFKNSELKRSVDDVFIGEHNYIYDNSVELLTINWLNRLALKPLPVDSVQNEEINNGISISLTGLNCPNYWTCRDKLFWIFFKVQILKGSRARFIQYESYCYAVCPVRRSDLVPPQNFFVAEIIFYKKCGTHKLDSNSS